MRKRLAGERRGISISPLALFDCLSATEQSPHNSNEYERILPLDSHAPCRIDFYHGKNVAAKDIAAAFSISPGR
jgi:hypothetical protein